MMLSDISSAIFGGLIIGGSAVLLLKTHGRIAGISGILGHSIAPSGKREIWRISFILGMMTAGVLVASVAPELIQVANGRNLLWLGIGGFLVGLGLG